jgi:hypothetical protein
MVKDNRKAIFPIPTHPETCEYNRTNAFRVYSPARIFLEDASKGEFMSGAGSIRRSGHSTKGGVSPEIPNSP